MFRFFCHTWPLEAKTAFYDWLYINALRKHAKLADVARTYHAFTDIEFNPARSINCQGHAVALFVALDARWLERLADPEAFLDMYNMFGAPRVGHGPTNAAQLDLLGNQT